VVDFANSRYAGPVASRPVGGIWINVASQSGG
jgi:hypothetical protein